MIIAMVAALLVLALGGAAFAYTDGSKERSQKRFTQVIKAPDAAKSARSDSDANLQKRKSVQALLKQIEAKTAETKKLTMRRRLNQAGFPDVSPRTFYIICGVIAALVGLLCFLTGKSILVVALAGFAAGFGLPRWILGFLRRRREKKFTSQFANAIDVIVRSVRTGLPTNEALKIVARESPDPVGGEFTRLVEGMKVGITLEQGCQRMYESMPTPEVSFFGIVMTIQGKSGGNLSEALSNLAEVLRDRKRLQNKIKAMSSEAKASAMIIGSLPPAVMLMVYLTTPAYISLLFSERIGNLELAFCVFWMGCGCFVMSKMINFKH